MTGSYVDYHDDEAVCEAYVANPAAGGRNPAVLVAHQWSGQSEAERAAADRLADLGYTGIAIDVYGKGKRGVGDDHSALMAPWGADRGALRRRLIAAVDFAKGHEAVDPARIGVIGYCFGGLCALDIARSGTTDVKGVVSIHGIYSPPGLGAQGPIAASVLVLHGWEDPLARPDAVLGLATELTGAGADWQLHAYGHAMHAFTAEHAHMPERGLMYDARAAARSWRAIVDFFGEVLWAQAAGCAPSADALIPTHDDDRSRAGVGGILDAQSRVRRDVRRRGEDDGHLLQAVVPGAASVAA